MKTKKQSDGARLARRETHVLNLGAGVQSTTLYLMSAQRRIQKFDHAIFADTQEEPEAVYRHLAWMESIGEPPILRCSAGSLGDDLINGTRAPGAARARFAAIPAFTTSDGGATHGRTQRQCSKEYKTQVIGRAIRRQVYGLAPGRSLPRGEKCIQYFGISLDEASRASRIYERFHVTNESKYEPRFPLIDLRMTRANCIEWLRDHGNVPHEVPRSACTFCPMHDDREWAALKASGGKDWARAVEIDAAMRDPASVMNRDMNQVMYLHRSCQPLTQIEFRPRDNPKEQQLGFGVECEGVCGV